MLTFVTKPFVGRLQNERNDGLALLWVVLELLLVVSVLGERPDTHLEHAGASEQQSGQTLRHDGERQPSAELVSVVGAGHEVEESG